MGLFLQDENVYVIDSRSATFISSMASVVQSASI